MPGVWFCEVELWSFRVRCGAKRLRKLLCARLGGLLWQEPAGPSGQGREGERKGRRKAGGKGLKGKKEGPERATGGTLRISRGTPEGYNGQEKGRTKGREKGKAAKGPGTCREQGKESFERH